jgi:serine/threonine-protein kinase
MGLTQKILLFTGGLVVALVATTLAITAARADRLAHATIEEGLKQTAEAWRASQADRYAKLKLGVRVLANDPYFKAALAERDQATTLDSLEERGRDLAADFVLAADADGLLVARTDRPAETGTSLAEDPVVRRALSGDEAAAVWRQGDRLYTAVAVPMQTGPDLVGVLVAGYGIDEQAASSLRRLTRSDIAYLVPDAAGKPHLVVSSLGPRESTVPVALQTAGAAVAGEAPFEIDLAGERYVGVRIPLEGAAGEEIGSVLALRSLAAETAAFRDFRGGLVLVSLVVTAVALLVAYLSAARISGPVRRLVDLVGRVRDGSFTGSVPVTSGDEIGALARAFNGLLVDLREKEAVIAYLRESVSSPGDSPAPTSPVAATAPSPDAPTLAVSGPTLPARPPGAALARGEILAARYEILGTLGRGGMGVVYRAHDRQLDETVALKLLRREALARDPSLLERFKQEIKLARRITHRCVLRTHDFGETDGVPYISMEYVEGRTLKDLVRSRGAMPVPVGLSVGRQVCEGLEAAHATGVVHRDIKPQNVLIIPETGQVKIMDFGIARVSSMDGASGLTVAGTIMGTPDYIPPEQAEGGSADFRSDIYSLGVMLYEAFTGQLPFKGETPMAIVVAHVRTPAPGLRAVRADLPPDLEAIVLRCLEKDPRRRWQTVAELKARLDALAARVEAAA